LKKTGSPDHHLKTGKADKAQCAYTQNMQVYTKREFSVPNQKWVQRATDFGIQSIELADLAMLDECDSSGELLDEVIDVYLQSAPVLIAVMEKSVPNRASQKIVRSAHALKSSSANLGAKELSNICQTIELDRSHIYFDEIAKLVGSATAEYQKVQVDLEKIKSFRKSSA
jgi:HPt (histidine-containing phosphotransfer) domain-containing protein